tara:strand:+ start:267 stop:1211 length:945 start_codon:yes stop_codon:yes gene_type:complete
MKNAEWGNIKLDNEYALQKLIHRSDNEKLDLNDHTFIIPYATDSYVRLWNLVTSILYLRIHTTANILIFSAEDPSLNIDKNLVAGLQGLYLPNLSNEFLQKFIERVKVVSTSRPANHPFHRTHYLNAMLSMTDTPYVVNFDADILLPLGTMALSAVALREEKADFVYPYGHGKYQRRLFIEDDMSSEKKIATAIIHSDFSGILGDRSLKWGAAYGQAIFANTEKYKEAGGENEEFISWGAEDVERFVRFTKLGYKILRLPSIVYHLEHPRGPDSGTMNPLFKHNEELWDRIQDMSVEELKEYYTNLEYRKNYDW